MKQTRSMKFLTLFLTIQMAVLSGPTAPLYADADEMELPPEQYVQAQADIFAETAHGTADLLEGAFGEIETEETGDLFAETVEETEDPFAETVEETGDPFAGITDGTEDPAALFDDVYPEDIAVQDPQDQDDAAALPGMQAEENMLVSDETEAEGEIESDNEAEIEADNEAETEEETEAETEAETEPLFEGAEPLLSASSAPEDFRHDIPLVVLRINETELYQKSKSGNWYGSIADMNASVFHDVRCEGTVEFLLPEGGYISEYGGGVPQGEIELDYIRGRGNSTWRNHKKKPYKIRLKDKENLFGMGKSKEWALMANSADPTLIKNRITSWLGDRMGFSWSPQMVPVDVVMIGNDNEPQYLGSYCLSELVDVEAPRLAISDDSGFLVSVYNLFQNADEPAGNFFSLDSGIKVIHEEPSFKKENELTDDDRIRREAIQSAVRRADELIMTPEIIDESTHNELSSLFDLETAADYWLIQEFSANPDSFQTSSAYLHKATNGLLTLGPLWDFDLAWGDPLSDKWYDTTTSGFQNTKSVWMDALRSKDPLFVALLKQEWEEMKPFLEGMTAQGGPIDLYQQEVSASREADYARWEGIESSYRVSDYDKLISNQKKWIKLRTAWIDSNLDDLPNSIVKISFEAGGKTVETKHVRKGEYLESGPEPPQKEGYVFVGWFKENSRDGIQHFRAEQDTTFVADYLEEEKAVKPEALYLSEDEVWVLQGDDIDINYRAFVFPETATDGRVRWTSSDPDVCTVDASGYVHGVAVGSAVLTGTFYNGIKNSLTVHVYDRSITSRMPEGVSLVPEKMKLTIGQREQVHVRFAPRGSFLKMMFLSVSSEDPSIADVRGYGRNGKVFLAEGMMEGETDLTVTAKKDGILYTASCHVTVESEEYEDQPESSGTPPEAETEPSGTPPEAETEPSGTPPKTETEPAVTHGPVGKAPDITPKTVQPKVKKKQPMTVKAKKPKVKASKLKKKKQIIKRKKAFIIKNAEGKVTFRKKSGSKRLKINKKTGAITVKKGTKKGTYKMKVKVTAAGNQSYKTGSKTVTVKVRVK